MRAVVVLGRRRRSGCGPADFAAGLRFALLDSGLAGGPEPAFLDLGVEVRRGAGRPRTVIEVWDLSG